MHTALPTHTHTLETLTRSPTVREQTLLQNTGKKHNSPYNTSSNQRATLVRSS